MLLDDNGEPQIFPHHPLAGRKGMEMTPREILGFAVDCLTDVYQKEGMLIIETNKSLDVSLPNFIMESINGKSYYVRVDPFVFPTLKSSFDIKTLSEFSRTAKAEKALPTLASVGLYCFDTNGLLPVCGGKFALKYDRLQAIEDPKTFWGRVFGG